MQTHKTEMVPGKVKGLLAVTSLVLMPNSDITCAATRAGTPFLSKPLLPRSHMESGIEGTCLGTRLYVVADSIGVELSSALPLRRWKTAETC